MRFWSFVLALSLAACSQAERPNFLVILCDDLGYGDLACYGHPVIQTNNLDALAESGIRLTACYSSAPVCSPSRVGLLTGRSPNRAGVYDWIPEAPNKYPLQRSLVHLRAEEPTIASLLQSAGYDTCMSGKWHCNSRFNDPAQPQPGDHGFDHWLATQNNAAPSHKNPVNFVRNGKPVGKVNQFSCQYVADEALRWLDGRSDKSRPFFSYVAFHEPHEPVASPANLVDAYRRQSENADQAQYFANVHNVDLAVGKLVNGLESRGLRENTLIVFTSDNGPETLNRYKSAQRSYGSPGPLRGMKLHTTDAGSRVAGIISWPHAVASQQISDTPISALDFLPTFCKLGGADLPENRVFDGTDFGPLLSGDSLSRRKPLLWIYYNALNQEQVAMRSGDYKVIADLDSGDLPRLTNVHHGNAERVFAAQPTNIQVYRVTNDISESKDLADENSPVIESLKTQLLNEYSNLIADSHVWKP